MKPTNYTCPPAAKIAAAMNLPRETAQTLRGLARGEVRIIDNPAFPKTNAWLNQCHNPPRRIDRILAAMDETAGTFGVECFTGRNWQNQEWPIAEYLNTGDTYATTLLFRHDTGTFRLTSWGDFVETNEKRLGLGTF